MKISLTISNEIENNGTFATKKNVIKKSKLIIILIDKYCKMKTIRISNNR